MATQSTAFSTLLKRFRARAFLTQARLAERAGLSLDAVNKLERGERQTPRCDTVYLLSRALQLTAQDQQALEDAARHDAHAHDQPIADPSYIAALLTSLTELHARQAALIDVFVAANVTANVAASPRPML